MKSCNYFSSEVYWNPMRLKKQQPLSVLKGILRMLQIVAVRLPSWLASVSAGFSKSRFKLLSGQYSILLFDLEHGELQVAVAAQGS